MNRLQVGLTDDLIKMLEHNGIDHTRCTDFKVEHTPKDGAVFITVTMIALKQEGES